MSTIAEENVEKRGERQVQVTFRLPEGMSQAIEERVRGRFSTVSEYLRDLIRRDLAGRKVETQTEEVGA